MENLPPKSVVNLKTISSLQCARTLTAYIVFSFAHTQKKSLPCVSLPTGIRDWQGRSGGKERGAVERRGRGGREALKYGAEKRFSEIR